MELALFNVHDGYLEGVVRGLRGAFLTREDYKRLAAADSLEGLVLLCTVCTPCVLGVKCERADLR